MFIFSRKSSRFLDNAETIFYSQTGHNDNITRRMRFACWITKATNTNSECAIVITFLLQQWLHESASVLRHICIACPVVCFLLGNYPPGNCPEESMAGNYPEETIQHSKHGENLKSRIACPVHLWFTSK